MSLPRRTLLLTLVSAGAWLALGVIELVSVTLTRETVSAATVRTLILSTAAGFAVCLLLFWVYGLLERRWRSWPLAGAAALACLTAAALRTLLGLLLWRSLMSAPRPRWQNVCAEVLWGFVMLGLFSVLYFTVRYWLELQDQREKTLRATALAHQAQLQMLRYQLNPHFLFNALNSIRAMILEDSAKSRQMIIRLSDFLRYSLDGEAKETTIGGEIAAIRNYVEIQNIRFERKLEVRTEIDPAAEQLVIPCFLIHPLVENAIKYGMDTSPMPLQVVVEVSRRADQLRIRVRNSGRLVNGDEDAVSAVEGTGTGLRNIRQRLELAFPDRHSFRIHESDGWVHAEIEVKLEPELA